jgi:hypothetical protein
MPRRLLSAIVDALRLPEPELVHFHRADGVPAACYDQRCPHPRLSVDE